MLSICLVGVGQGSSHLMRQGSGLHRLCTGTGLGAVLARPDNTLGMSVMQAFQSQGVHQQQSAISHATFHPPVVIFSSMLEHWKELC